MTKLKAISWKAPNASQFYADIEGHPASAPCPPRPRRAQFFTSELRILGVYKAHPYRATIVAGD